MKRYRKGADKERRIVNEAREQGLIAFRSAGSHSPIDVCIVDAKKAIIHLIQSKSDSFPKSAAKKLREKYSFLHKLFLVIFEVR